MENMSAAPYLARNIRWGMKFGDTPLVDSMLYDGLWDVYNNFLMGMTGERIAEKFGITRQEADAFSLESNLRAASAIREGKFRQEIVPVYNKGQAFDTDECVREDTSLEKLAALPPAFTKDGILTAGNSSKLSDGAAALVVDDGVATGQAMVGEVNCTVARVDIVDEVVKGWSRSRVGMGLGQYQDVGA
jgi:acetyl-CoA C-acetyltransferase